MDPYGERATPKQTINTVLVGDGPKANRGKKCGAIKFWTVKFQLDQASKKGGIIVQYITVKARIWSCSKKKWETGDNGTDNKNKYLEEYTLNYLKHRGDVEQFKKEGEFYVLKYTEIWEVSAKSRVNKSPNDTYFK